MRGSSSPVGHTGLEEPHVPVEQQPDVGHAVAQHRDPVRAHAERPAGVALADRARTFSSTAGCTMPQPEDLHPPGALARGAAARRGTSWHSTSISADGSVNGKNDGRKRVFVAGEKNRWAKWVSVALRSTNEIPSSTARPSICEKAGACEASKASLR